MIPYAAYGRHAPTPEVLPEPTTADFIADQWRSMLICGEPHYYDASAGLWLTIDDAVRNVEARKQFRRVMGDTDYTRIANRYEKGRGL